jgi:hypothetical protein
MEIKIKRGDLFLGFNLEVPKMTLPASRDGRQVSKEIDLYYGNERELKDFYDIVYDSVQTLKTQISSPVRSTNVDITISILQNDPLYLFKRVIIESLAGGCYSMYAKQEQNEYVHCFPLDIKSTKAIQAISKTLNSK